MLRRRDVVAALAAAAGVGAVRPAAAASLEFQPVLTEAPSGAFTSTLQIANRGGGDSALQLRAFAWTQSGAPGDTLTFTDKLLISPPMVMLPNGETQTVRLVLRTMPSSTEQAFRVVVDEIPHAQPGQVAMALRVSLPVFVAGASGPAALRWHVVPDGTGQVLVIATNDGVRRARIANLALAGAGLAPASGKLLDQNPYVLAGGERRWRVSAHFAAGEQVRLTADHETGSVAVSLVVGA